MKRRKNRLQWTGVVLGAALSLAPLAAARAQGGNVAAAHGTPPSATDAPLGKNVDGRTAPLFENLGKHTHPVTTKSPRAQRYFDQGLILSYAFNHAESARAFKEAARLDPECAMAWWGVAFVLGPNINAAMDKAVVPEAWDALRKAQVLADKATAREQAYIAALAKRYSSDPNADRKALDAAFADAMRDVMRRFPDDNDSAVIFAESVMDTRPWNYWTKEGKPQPGTMEVIETLESVVRRDPDHPGALHFHIHVMEASKSPERALGSAHRLRHLVPGAGHLVHMPAHIYIRTGLYHEASLANERAILSDNAYFATCRAQGLYPLGYRPHNHHFLWAAETMLGRGEKAIAAAKQLAVHTDQKLLKEPGMGTLQHFSMTPLYAQVRFGRWDDVLATPAPDADMVYPTGVWTYAHGTAFLRTGKLPEAETALGRLEEIAKEPELAKIAFWEINTAKDVLAVAVEALRGDVLAAKGDYAGAVAALKQAVAKEDALNYDEPQPWFLPMRQALGAVLLDAGRAAEAESIYREDLERNPENGWSLYGLLRALRAQGKGGEAATVEQRFRNAWAHADTVLTASRF